MSASDLFGNYRLLKRDGRPVNERAMLVGFFADELQRAPKLIGIRLGHYSVDEMYALQSAFKDRKVRDGQEAAEKYWWFTTRTQKLSPDAQNL